MEHGLPSLGSLLLRGESGALTVSLGSLTRVRSNPFWPIIESQIEAIVAAGRLDKIKVSGNNGNADALAAMKEGKLVCSPRQLPRDQGYWGVVTAWMAIKGLDCPSEIHIDSPLVTPENLEEHLKYSY